MTDRYVQTLNFMLYAPASRVPPTEFSKEEKATHGAWAHKKSNRYFAYLGTLKKEDKSGAKIITKPVKYSKKI